MGVSSLSLESGDGITRPQQGDTVVVKYRGHLDSRYGPSCSFTKAKTINLGDDGSTIQGLHMGLEKMTLGQVGAAALLFEELRAS